MNKFISVIVAIPLLVSAACHAQTPSTNSPSANSGLVASVAQFGAVGDGVTDDTAAIQTALNSSSDIVFENKKYLLKGPVIINQGDYHSVNFRGATIVKADSDNQSFEYDHRSNITIEGGTFVCAIQPTANSNKGVAVAFRFVGCENVVIRNTHINGSAEMGICIMSCDRVLAENNFIENCFRDGIYSHYSNNVRYLNNRLENIKDDALSFHDYGLDVQKKDMLDRGYTQAGQWIVSGNVIRNTYEGIVSLGGEKLIITNNIIEHTVNGGIFCFTADTLAVGSTATSQNITIANNQLFQPSQDTKIMGVVYQTGPPPLAPGNRPGGICIQSAGAKPGLDSYTRRDSNYTIANNLVVGSGTVGISAHAADHVTITGNTVVNCNELNNEFNTNPIDILSCSDILLDGNNVIDSRAKPLHARGYLIEDSTGTAVNFNIKGYAIEPGKIVKSTINK